jgi:N-acetyl-1-D-myo-inositol-2-amino-2-deoxy-alpha-D-glucopyranoside deacetylase
MAAAARILPLVFAFATGAGTGFVLTFTHRQFLVDFAGVALPLGLLGGLAIVAALIAGMRLAFAERAAPIAAAAGVILGSAVLVLPGNSGSLYVPDDPAGFVWAVAPTVLAIIIIGWPSPKARSAQRRGVADEW